MPSYLEILGVLKCIYQGWESLFPSLVFLFSNRLCSRVSGCCLVFAPLCVLWEWLLCQELPKYLAGKKASLVHPSSACFCPQHLGMEHPRWAEAQSIVTTKHSRYWWGERLNYQTNSGCIYGSRDDMKPWWKSCSPRCCALIGFSKYWDKTKSLTGWAAHGAMLMTRSKGKVTESSLTRQETCHCGGHLLAPAKKVWEGTPYYDTINGPV